MEFHLRFDKMALPTNQILAYSLVMFAGTKIVMLIIGHFVSPYGRYTAFFSLIPGVIVGAGIYLYLCLKSRLADQLLGPRVARLRTILHIK